MENESISVDHASGLAGAVVGSDIHGGIAVGLERSFSASPVVDESAQKLGADLTVGMAAAHLGKSTRTIQRLLQSGALKGYKVQGPKGPEWRIKHRSLKIVEAAAVDSEAVLLELNTRLEGIEGKLAVVARELQTASVKINRLESEIFSLRAGMADGARIKSELASLNADVRGIKCVTAEVEPLKVQCRAFDSIIVELRAQCEQFTQLLAGQNKAAWWKRAFER